MLALCAPPLGCQPGECLGQRGHSFGAIGVGGTKMKIHHRAIERLFEANDLVLDAEEIFELGRGLAK